MNMLSALGFQQNDICLSSSLIDVIDQGMLVLDSKGTVVAVNQWFEKQLGYSKRELHGLTHQQLFNLLFSQHNLSYEHFRYIFNRVLHNCEVLELRRNYKDKNGNIVPVQSILHPFTNQRGESQGVIVVIQETDEILLYDIAKNLNSTLELKEVLKITNEEIVNQLGLSSNAIFLLDEDSDELYLAVCNGWSDSDLAKVRIKLGEGIPGLIAKEGTAIYVENMKTDSRIDSVARKIHPDKSSIGYPMFFKGTLLGVVTFDSFGVRKFSQRELKLFQKIADFVSAVIYNSKAYERALLKASIDELTGLFNHRHFHEVLDEEFKAAVNRRLSLSMILLDLDHFKDYNNLYGYEVGDALLKNTASIIKEVVGKKGKLARFGADEFAILLPSVNVEEALGLAEELRNQLNTTAFNLTPIQVSDEKISASFGVAGYPAHTQKKEDLVSFCAHALKLAKQRNKNKVVSYFSLIDDILNSVQKDEQEALLAIKTLMQVINTKDNYTVGHSERVTEYALLIGKELRLNKRDMQKLSFAAYLHDIGKIEISREILNKKGKLTDDEFHQIKKHPENGVDLLAPIKSLASIIPMVKHHHERYDGRGYPSGLEGEEIPYFARIICVADSFDAIISSRPYKTAQTIGFAMKELERCAGTQFDPKIAHAFVKVLRHQFYEYQKTAF